MSGGEREFHDKVHTKHVPPQVWDLERVQFTHWSLSYWFCSEAEITDANILSDVPRHLRPPVRATRVELQEIPQLITMYKV